MVCVWCCVGCVRVLFFGVDGGCFFVVFVVWVLFCVCLMVVLDFVFVFGGVWVVLCCFGLRFSVVCWFSVLLVLFGVFVVVLVVGVLLGLVLGVVVLFLVLCVCVVCVGLFVVLWLCGGCGCVVVLWFCVCWCLVV